MAEILIERGEWAEAETLLLETLRFWRASEYRYFLGAGLSLAGRVSLRLGRLDEALSRLDEAKANFLHVGAGEEMEAETFCASTTGCESISLILGVCAACWMA